ncbi:LysR family transcriptional regulator [Cohnella nanjingensis]|uniref:LysR family transcriptional regulator n=1 Tax=Cohnella nanjingensis TaxID=1387779 RepID=A0A7X0RQG0_9BACL|nr:LysR family transcriptional regulator [Cohnella nanjingensis]MBB6670530.1 LysR family transcriptional regulator [Cohnella nanjingensis]
MQVEWFRSFTESVKRKSLSKAAESLNLTQPAVSKHIRNLEVAYGVELFRRGTAGVELTAAGRLFLERIAPVVEAIDAVGEEMRARAERPRFALGSLPSVAAHVLPGRLRDYNAAGYPLSVSVRGTSEELAAALLEGTFDAVLIDADYTGGRMWSRELFTEDYLVVLPPRHRFRRRRALRTEELKEETFVFVAHCDSCNRFKRVAARYDYVPDTRMELDNTDYMLGIMAVGNDITVLPRLFGHQAERLGLHVVPLQEERLRRTIALAARTAVTGARLYRMLDASRVRETEASEQG